MKDEIIKAIIDNIPKPKKFSEKYKILYHVGNVPIRKNNLLSIYMPENAMARLAKICYMTGLSAAKVLALSSQPCDCCRDKDVEITIDGVPYLIPRGLFTAKRTNSGLKIQDKKRGGL